MSTYDEKLKDPRWQKMRLKILERDGWTCRSCEGKEDTLHVHHTYYDSGIEPWDYPPTSLVTLCEDCHEAETGALRQAEEEALLSVLRYRGYLSEDINSILCDIYSLTTGKSLAYLLKFFEKRFEIEKRYG